MNQDVASSLRRSTEDFLRLVWPQIGRQFGRIIPVESVTANDFATELDARAGIDVWVINGGDGCIRGLASRVQWPRLDAFDTFTVRVRSATGRATEWHKRRRELATEGAIRPHYICQAYVRCVSTRSEPGHRGCSSGDHTELIRAAIARTRDVITAVDDRAGRLLPANHDGTQGFAVSWEELRQRGAPLMIWPDPVGAQLAA